MQKLARQSGRQKGGHKNSQPNPAQFAFEVLTALPHETQFHMESAQRTIWGMLRNEAMVISTSDILLKHGATLAGSWSLLGILDARPDAGAQIAPITDGLGGDIITDGLTALLRGLAATFSVDLTKLLV